MVELEAITDETPSTTTAVTPPKTNLCRLCLNHDDFQCDIFEEHPSDENNERKPSIVERLFELFQIKYEKSISLPHNICKRCLYMVEAFTNFRDNIRTCETELQKRLITLKLVPPTCDRTLNNCPGINGNPGIFVPDDNCIIIEVNPDQEYESSDEDFSMESDLDEEESTISTPATTIAVPTQSIDVHNLYTTTTTAAATVAATTLSFDNGANASITTNAANVSNNNNDAPSSALGDSIPLEVIVKNPFFCQYCDMAFTTQDDSKEHESRHDPSVPFVCSFCSLRTNTRQSLICHIKEVHDPERPFVCALCNKGFCRRSDLKKHTIVHTGVRPYSCSVCTKSFSRNTNLTKHMRIHSTIRPHVCQRCPRSFSTANELLRHSRSHPDMKPFQCSRCSASFTRKDKLQLHEQAHLKRDSEFLSNQNAGVHSENIVVPLNPYNDSNAEIPTPAAATINTEDLYRHSILAAQLQQRPIPIQTPPVASQLIHSTPPPPPPPVQKSSHHSRNFTCEICSKQFTRERDLQRHQALHLDSLFTCKQCGTGFSRKEKLRRHEQQYHTPKHACEICRMTFSRRDELETHLKMHELQQNVALNIAQATLATSSGASGSGSTPMQQATPPPLPPSSSLGQTTSPQQILPPPSAADMSFYSQLVPTMNLGFYSETRPEDRNGI